MNDLSAFLSACLSSPALLTSSCAVIVVPGIAWLIVRALTPALRRMDNDPSWQAPLAAAFAGLPGLLFIVIGAATLRTGWNSACLQFVTGQVLYATIAALTVLALARATALAVRRGGEVRSLVRGSSDPSARTREAAQSVGIRIREVAADGPVVLLAGLWRPVIFVSADAAMRVNDAELLAAIRHEAAHAKRGDLLVAAAITFIADFVPLPAGALIALFRRAREFAADAHATRDSDPCDLASALLALARPAHAVASVAAFAERGTVRDRLGALLKPPQSPPSRWRRTALTAALCATFALGAAPAIGALLFGFTCTMTMPA